MIQIKCSAVFAVLLFGANAFADGLSVKNGNLPDVFTQFDAVNEVSFTATGVPNGCTHHTYMEDIDRVAWNIENESTYTTFSLPKIAKKANGDFNDTNPKYRYLPRARPHMVEATAQIKSGTGLLNPDCSWMALQVRGPRDLVVPMDKRANDGVLATKRIAYQRYAKQFLNHRTVPDKALNKYALNPEQTMIYVVLKSDKGQILEPAALRHLEELTGHLNTEVPGLDRASLISLWAPSVRWTEVTADGFQGDTVMPSSYLPGLWKPAPELVQRVKDNVKRADLFGYMVNDEQSATLIRAAMLNAKQIKRQMYPSEVHSLDSLYSKRQFQQRWVEPLTALTPEKLEGALAVMVKKIGRQLPKSMKLQVAVVYGDAFGKGVNPDPFYQWTDEQKAEAKKKYPFIFE